MGRKSNKRNKSNKPIADKPDTSKLCIDCEFCNGSSDSPFCLKSEGIDLVTGKKEYSRARTMRYDGQCGVAGKLFKIKVK